MNITIRERTEKIESEILSQHAALSKNSLGRDIAEIPCKIRTVYQCDRDRILHSKAFRRLKRKTQVFVCPEGDHYRTRLTHTLEVSQIARTVARAMGLNEDLTEAIALGHDLGHTPFGHAGEEVFNRILPEGFRHYEQSVRVVERLENEGKGLNLTKEVRNGILCHTKGTEAFTFEGKIVRLCDKIAYINHDIDDAIRAGIISPDEIPHDFIKILGKDCPSRVNTMIISMAENSQDGKICMSNEIIDIFWKVHKFMYENVYSSKIAKSEDSKAGVILQWLYEYFTKNCKKMPEDIQEIVKREGLERGVCDYIAGMTDYFAISLFKEKFIPKPWKGVNT